MGGAIFHKLSWLPVHSARRFTRLYYLLILHAITLHADFFGSKIIIEIKIVRLGLLMMPQMENRLIDQTLKMVW